MKMDILLLYQQYTGKPLDDIKDISEGNHTMSETIDYINWLQETLFKEKQEVEELTSRNYLLKHKIQAMGMMIRGYKMKSQE